MSFIEASRTYLPQEAIVSINDEVAIFVVVCFTVVVIGVVGVDVKQLVHCMQRLHEFAILRTDIIHSISNTHCIEE